MSLVDSLSQEQQVVLAANGKFVLRACPGSGKTFTVSAKIEDLLKGWTSNYQGIAALSFTNVAWKEVEKNLVEHNIHFNYPHFLGTLDSFINKHIFLPFGHLVMECDKRPELVGEPYGSWSFPILGKGYKAYYQYFDIFSFNIDNELIAIGDTTGCFFGSKWEQKGHADNIKQAKGILYKKGYANQFDANFFALKILENYPNIAKSLIERFPYFIIDEGQDTTEIQMAIIEKLIEYRLENVILVGDPDQSIYEWNFARPELFTNKYNEWNNHVLNENRRSSQLICNHTHNLSSLTATSTSVSDQPDITPEVVTFSESTINDTIDSFIDTCKSHGIEITEENVAVIFRSKSLLDPIKGIQSTGYGVNKHIWKAGEFGVKDIVQGKYFYDCGQYKTGFKSIKHGLIKRLTQSNNITKETINSFLDTQKMSLTQFRAEVYKFINDLPDTANILMKDFIKEANDKNERLNLQLKEDTLLHVHELFTDNTSQEHKKCRVGTIHSVKGETFEAVLLFLKKKDRKNYTTFIKEGNFHENEEMRNVYVAITRPRKFVMIAVPDETNKTAWKQVLGLQ